MATVDRRAKAKDAETDESGAVKLQVIEKPYKEPMSTAHIVALTTAAVTLVGALVTGSVAIITTLRDTKSSVQRTESRGIDRDEKIQQIHVLVNSRLSAVLRMLVATLKQKAERTKSIEDIAAYEAALAELQVSQGGAIIDAQPRELKPGEPTAEQIKAHRSEAEAEAKQ